MTNDPSSEPTVTSRCALDKREALPSKVFWSAMLCALLFPTVLTLTYFVLLTDFSSGVQQTVYGIGKVVQFAFPAVFVFGVLRCKPQSSWFGMRGVGVGLGFGAAVLVIMLLLYHFWLRSSGFMSGLEQQVVDKVRDLNLDSMWKYAATGVFYSLAHSLLEEYYWRWFVFGRLQLRIGVPAAILVSSLGFMAHHIVLLATFFGWDSPLAYLFSLGVAIGGVVWAWIYSWSRSLLGPWLSHMLIDTAIFLIGYDLVREILA